jgi:hypothetical protein
MPPAPVPTDEWFNATLISIVARKLLLTSFSEAYTSPYEHLLPMNDEDCKRGAEHA